MFLGSPNGSFKLEPYRSPPQCIIQVAELYKRLNGNYAGCSKSLTAIAPTGRPLVKRKLSEFVNGATPLTNSLLKITFYCSSESARRITSTEQFA
jgi:hypothetical protein